MKVTIINYTPDAAKLLVYTKNTRLTLGEATRAKVDAMSPEEIAKELKYISTSIPSSWEFVDYTFELTGVSRAFAEQFKRTRTGSYAQQTMRMLDVGDFDVEVGPTIMERPGARTLYEATMGMIRESYEKLIRMGAAIEDARGVLPLNIHTNLIAKFNLRTLAEMARSRTGGRTQGEYREVFTVMCGAVIDIHPWASDFLFPDKLSPVRVVESILTRERTALSKEDHTTILKQLDLIKKSL